MRKLNMVYTFSVPENPTGLKDSMWVACVIHELGKFLHGLLGVNGVAPAPLPPGYIVDQMAVKSQHFGEQVMLAVWHIFTHSRQLFSHVATCAIDLDNKYLMTTKFKVIGVRWVKLYLRIDKVEGNNARKD